MSARIAAVKCHSLPYAQQVLAAVEAEGFRAQILEYGSTHYVAVTENSAGDVEDTVFELSFHGLMVGTIPRSALTQVTT